MKSTERFFIALAILIIDVFVFFIPLTALFCVYILMVRPLWFREWVSRIYDNT